LVISTDSYSDARIHEYEMYCEYCGGSSQDYSADCTLLSATVGYYRPSLFLGFGTPKYRGDPSRVGRVASTYCISGILTVVVPRSENI
jgi:hypothetical protein